MFSSKSVYRSPYHGIKVRFQEGVVSRLDGARLGALIEVGEHKRTNDVVIIRHLSQHLTVGLLEAQAMEWMLRPEVCVLSKGQNSRGAISGLQ